MRGPDVTILHIADTHLWSASTAIERWLRDLPRTLDIVPDVVIGTGDFIEDDAGIDRFLSAVAGIDARYGKYYVFGSHDYYQSRFKPVTRYFSSRREMPTVRADTPRLQRGLEDLGWHPLLNDDHVLEIDGSRVRLSGVDDPYIHRHRIDHLKRSIDDDLAIGLMHSPELVSEWALHGYDLALAGHTHGGQIRLPAIGALVTNSTLPTALAMGAHRVGAAWLYVSPGLGTSRFAPIRFMARPTATLIRTVAPREGKASNS